MKPLQLAMLSLLLGSSLAGAVPTDPPTTTPAPPPEFDQALQALDAGDVERALAVLEGLVETGDTPPQVRALLGVLYLDEDRPADALRMLTPLTEVEPPQAAVFYHAGRAALGVGDAPLALEYLSRSVELEPGTPASRELGLLLGRQGRVIDAYRLLKPWAEGHPDDRDVRLAAAHLALQLNRLPDAEGFLSDLPQDDPRVRLLWGRLLSRRGEPYAVIAVLRPLQRAEGDVANDAIGVLADAYLAVGDSQQAIELLQTRPEIETDGVMALKLAQAFYQGAELEQALTVLAPHAQDVLEGGAESLPQAGAVAREHGRFLSAAGRHAEALPYLRLATELEPEAKQAWQALGQALAGTGATEDARKALNRFQQLAEAQGSATDRQDRLQQEQQDPTARELRRAAELSAAGAVEEALEVLHTEMALAPEDLRPRLMASQLELQEGNIEQALALADEAVQQQPTSADARYQLGAVLLVAEDLESAEQQFRLALELAPEHIAAMNDLAVLLMVQGRKQEARSLLEKVLEIQPDNRGARSNLQQLESEE